MASTLGLEPSHRLTGLYAEALNQLGAWLPDHPLPETADALARSLTQMPFFADHGFYKRAQIAANDLQLAQVVDFPDIDRLTIFWRDMNTPFVLVTGRKPVNVEKMMESMGRPGTAAYRPEL